MNRIAIASLTLIITSLAVADDVAGRKVLADFETSGATDVIAAGADSKPWQRFGEATADNIVATRDPASVLAGKASAMYPVFWPNRFGAAAMVADAPIDLTGDKSALITIRSTAAETKTQVMLSVSDGKTTFTSKTSQKLTDKPQTLTFSLAAADMERVDGPPVELPAVLAKIASIGFKVSSDGSKYSETILFDNLAVTK